MSVLQSIERLFADNGRAAYFGEPVSQTEHALQAAHLAEEAGAGNALVVAALLHDVGHLQHGLPESIAEHGVDAHHETVGAQWLARHFGAVVVEPVRLHVTAKRYLCTIDPVYREHLSPASQSSLELQGGPMTDAEIEAFEREPYYRDAVDLRRWDDQAKTPGWKVPGLKHYNARLAAVAENQRG
jgi:phosphonate degradation associated HDIG domain protein